MVDVATTLQRLRDSYRFRQSAPYQAWRWARHPGYARRTWLESRFYSRLLGSEPFGLIFDIGASAGAKAEIFTRHGAVVCVEAGETAAARLRRRFADCPNVTVVHAAVSNTTGRGTFWEFEPGSAFNTMSERWVGALTNPSNNRFGFAMPQPRSNDIRMITVDGLIEQHGRPRYIKLDIEGFEWNAIQGLNQPCELLSAEFNLPEFAIDLEQAIGRLDRLGGNALFNVAIAEPPLRFEFDPWLPGPLVLERISQAGWRYVELFCRTALPRYV